MDFKFAIKILEQLEQFKASQNGRELTELDFATWIINNNSTKDKPENPHQDGLIGMNLGFIHNYMMFYSRKLFKNSAIYSIYDYGILMSLFPDKSLKKIDVLKQNILEKSSGNEILKRLLKQGLLIETENEFDKRSKLVSISENGFNEINKIAKQINDLSATVVGNLEPNEKQFLLSILTKLHLYHNPIFLGNDYD
jgi:MarR family transcriptional regulator, lower aerobic nicotinate degradation pathway regulator